MYHESARTAASVTSRPMTRPIVGDRRYPRERDSMPSDSAFILSISYTRAGLGRRIAPRRRRPIQYASGPAIAAAAHHDRKRGTSVIRLPTLKALLGAGVIVLLVNTGYIAAFASPTIFYMTNVLAHLVLGVVLAVGF